MNSTNAREDSARVFYCQIDTYLATKDYLRQGRCVRLIGVNEADYKRLADGPLGEGVNTLVLDIDLWTFILKKEKSLLRLSKDERDAEIRRMEDGLKNDASWIKLTADLSKSALNYFYPAFSSEQPTYFSLTDVQSSTAPALSGKATALALATPAGAQATAVTLEDFKNESALARPEPQLAAIPSSLEFVAFHVGQGMCSMLYNKHCGVMFDAGAGKPITRKAYQGGKLTNDLKSLVAKLKKVPYVILSHFDHDHWRMLAWDNDLLKKVGTILVPDTVDLQGRNLAFFDVKVVKRVKKVSDFWMPIDNVTDIYGYRSTPSTADSNGECLVCKVRLDECLGLVPGDYVCARMKCDKNPAIKDLVNSSYNAVIVPHHGDKESGEDIPDSCPGGLAFFSAGNHQTWGHPSPISTANHELAGYKVVVDNTQSNIVKSELLCGRKS